MAIFDSFMIGATPKSSHYDVVTTVEIKMAATSMGHYSTEKWNLNRSHWITTWICTYYHCLRIVSM